MCAKEVSWHMLAKKHEIRDFEEGIWFEPIKALLKRKLNRIWTTRHAAQARSCVINGAWTHKRLYDMNCADSKCCKCCHAEGTAKHRLYHGGEWREEMHMMPDVEATT